MKVQAECLEIFDFLLAEIREIESVTSTEEINTDDLIKLDRPLSEWDDVLKSNGFESKLLQEFLLSAEVLELWKGEEPLIAIYQQAIEKSLTTGDFLVLLFSQDPKFLESLLNLVSPLLSERADLMELGGGKMGAGGIGGITTASVFFVGALVVAYCKRDWIRKKIWPEASDAVSNVIEHVHFRRDLMVEARRDILHDAQVTIESREENLALRILDKSGGKIRSVEQEIPREEFHSKFREFRENPVAMDKYLDKEFNLDPKDYVKSITHEYDQLVSSIETSFTDKLTRIAIKQIENIPNMTEAQIDESIKKLSNNLDNQLVASARKNLVRDTKKLLTTDQWKSVLRNREITQYLNLRKMEILILEKRVTRLEEQQKALNIAKEEMIDDGYSLENINKLINESDNKINELQIQIEGYERLNKMLLMNTKGTKELYENIKKVRDQQRLYNLRAQVEVKKEQLKKETNELDVLTKHLEVMAKQLNYERSLPITLQNEQRAFLKEKARIIDNNFSGVSSLKDVDIKYSGIIVDTTTKFTITFENLQQTIGTKMNVIEELNAGLSVATQEVEKYENQEKELKDFDKNLTKYDSDFKDNEELIKIRSREVIELESIIKKNNDKIEKFDKYDNDLKINDIKQIDLLKQINSKLLVIRQREKFFEKTGQIISNIWVQPDQVIAEARTKGLNNALKFLLKESGSPLVENFHPANIIATDVDNAIKELETCLNEAKRDVTLELQKTLEIPEHFNKKYQAWLNQKKKWLEEDIKMDINLNPTEIIGKMQKDLIAGADERILSIVNQAQLNEAEVFKQGFKDECLKALNKISSTVVESVVNEIDNFEIDLQNVIEIPFEL